MQLTLYNGINKRRNSTALPSGSGTIVEVYLKESTSIINPIFILQGDYFTIVSSAYNYAFFNGRYYWINDIFSLKNNLVEIRCDVDVLATYRLNIKASTAFIKYAATAYNSLIIDHRISQVATQRSYQTTSSSAMFTDSGCAVLQYISGNDNDTVGGGVCADAMYLSSMSALGQELYTAGTNIWDELIKQAGSVADCLTSAIYLPIELSEVGTGNMRAQMIGNYQSTYGIGSPITSRYWTKTRSVSIPWPTSDFRRAYCDISISLPFAGVVKISPTDVLNDSAIDVIAIVDKLTGKGIYYLSHNTENVRPFMTVPFMCGSQIALSTYQNNTLGGVQSIVIGSTAGLMTGNPLTVASTAIAGASQMLQFSPSMVGQNSGAISLSNHISLTLNYCPTAIEPSNVLDVIGRPYMAVNSLSGFSGYVETSGFSLTAGLALGDEKERVNEYMDSGVYLE